MNMPKAISVLRNTYVALQHNIMYKNWCAVLAHRGQVMAISHFDFSMLPSSRPARPQAEAVDPERSDHLAKLHRSLETLFPDLLVHGTRNCLLNMTTSITKVSGRANSYFSKLSQALAFDRLMRSFMRFTAALSPFSVDPGTANYWGNPFLPSHHTALPWGVAAQPQQPAPANPFFPAAFQPQTAAKPPASAWDAAVNPFFPAAFQPQTAAKRPASAWDAAVNPFLPAAIQPPATAARQSPAWTAPANPFFPAAFHAQPAAATHAAAWADYNTMMLVPLTLLAATPEIQALWRFAV